MPSAFDDALRSFTLPAAAARRICRASLVAEIRELAATGVTDISFASGSQAAIVSPNGVTVCGAVSSVDDILAWPAVLSEDRSWVSRLRTGELFSITERVDLGNGLAGRVVFRRWHDRLTASIRVIPAPVALDAAAGALTVTAAR